METERFSHVMHLTSEVSGVLKPGLSSVDAFAAAFPAGTLSGAPKIRALQIIDELEGVQRGPYGGAVGWFSGAGDVQLAIAIRTLFRSNGRLVRAGGRGDRGRQRSRRGMAGGARQGAGLGRRGVRRGGGEGGRMKPRVLVIDNYDSFTFNLVQRLGELGARVDVLRNDAADAEEILARRPERLVLSPGPCTPNEAGVCLELIARACGLNGFARPQRAIPILGVCLGHQSIGQAFGGKVVRARAPVHGKAEEIVHDGRGLFRGAPKPLRGGRYHSLVVEMRSLPRELEVSARTRDGIVMGLRHRKLPVFGVQFHPESILTPDGQTLLRNFLEV